MKKLFILVFLTFTAFSSCKKRNSLDLKFSETLDKLNFKIEMEVLGSDFSKVLIYDGNKQYTIQNGYGENEWYFNYKDSLFAYFRHIKTNRNDSHNYNYNFIEKNGKIQVEVQIDGVSKMNKIINFTKKND